MLRYATVSVFLSMSSSGYAFPKTLDGTSVNEANWHCRNDALTEMQEQDALAELQNDIRRQRGVCAWHMGELSEYGTPEIKIHSDGENGCVVTATQVVECFVQ